jgi:hypothetical protein
MTQTFYNYMAQFLKEKNAKDVVEIGSDVQLKTALRLAPYCENFYSVNFPEHHVRMRGWYEMHQSMGVNNIKLLSGDALQLPKLISHADVIILQNVLIDGDNGKDTKLMWKYRNGGMNWSDAEWNKLTGKFMSAEENAYRGFLQVAKPGFIVRFEWPEENGAFMNRLIDKLGIDASKIQSKELLWEENKADIWQAYIIDNR